MYCRCPAFLLAPATAVPAELTLNEVPLLGLWLYLLPHWLFSKKKDKTFILRRMKRRPRYCLQSAEIYYDRTMKAENENAPGKNNAVAYDGL